MMHNSTEIFNTFILYEKTNKGFVIILRYWKFWRQPGKLVPVHLRSQSI